VTKLAHAHDQLWALALPKLNLQIILPKSQNSISII